MNDTGKNETGKPALSISHQGELEMRKRLPSRHKMNEEKLAKMVQDHISPKFAEFIARQPFFFIATASDTGECDANFRGRDSAPSGQSRPLLKVLDSKTIIFPDFSGNGFYNSLGNIHLNPHIGMLFMDFQEQQRARVNGKAFVEELGEWSKDWPGAQALVRVEIEQVYWNCTARIPKMKIYSNSDKIIRLGRRR